MKNPSDAPQRSSLLCRAIRVTAAAMLLATFVAWLLSWTALVLDTSVGTTRTLIELSGGAVYYTRITPSSTPIRPVEHRWNDRDSYHLEIQRANMATPPPLSY